MQGRAAFLAGVAAVTLAGPALAQEAAPAAPAEAQEGAPLSPLLVIEPSVALVLWFRPTRLS